MLNVAATDGVKQISVLASMSQRPRDPGDMRLLAVRIARGTAITSCADATCGSVPCGFIVQHDDGSPVNHVLRYTWVYSHVIYLPISQPSHALLGALTWYHRMPPAQRASRDGVATPWDPWREWVRPAMLSRRVSARLAVLPRSKLERSKAVRWWWCLLPCMHGCVDQHGVGWCLCAAECNAASSTPVLALLCVWRRRVGGCAVAKR